VLFNPVRETRGSSDQQTDFYRCGHQFMKKFYLFCRKFAGGQANSGYVTTGMIEAGDEAERDWV
jgi:hypothetical protein